MGCMFLVRHFFEDCGRDWTRLPARPKGYGPARGAGDFRSPRNAAGTNPFGRGLPV